MSQPFRPATAGIDRVLALAVFIGLGSSGFVQAQTLAPENPWSRGTTIAVAGGAGFEASSSGPLIGGGVGWEMTPRIGLDGAVHWFSRSEGSEAFAAALTVRAALAGSPVAPFLRGGVGLYRMTFDGARPDEVPGFYGRRLTPSAGSRIHHTFTDPTLILGGGVDFFLTRKLALAPQWEVAWLRRQGHSHVVTAASIRIAYHIEEHPITPDR